MQHDRTVVKEASKQATAAMEAALCLRRNQTATRRPLHDLSSVNQRRNTPRKHHLISMPIAAHSQRQIVCSHVNPTPSTPRSPSSTEALKCRKADGRAEGSGLRWPRAGMAGVMLACALTGGACMRLACARGRTEPNNSSEFTDSDVDAQDMNKSPIKPEAPALAETHTLLSEILLAKKTTDIGNRTLLNLIGEYYCRTCDVKGTLDLLFRIFSKGIVEDSLHGVLLVNIYIAMAVVDMVLAVEKMLEPNAEEKVGVDMINKAKEAWESCFKMLDVEITKARPEETETNGQK